VQQEGQGSRRLVDGCCVSGCEAEVKAREIDRRGVAECIVRDLADRSRNRNAENVDLFYTQGLRSFPYFKVMRLTCMSDHHHDGIRIATSHFAMRAR
jgi:hypothetical protein